MGQKTSYAVWNNKGGVGKSTIAFHLAARFAEKHRDKKVLVIDLCPQANVSMMMLGGATAGENLVLSFCSAVTPQTVVGYLSEVLSGVVAAHLGRGLSSMKQGYYPVHGSDVKVNSDQTGEALMAIDKIISVL